MNDLNNNYLNLNDQKRKNTINILAQLIKEDQNNIELWSALAEIVDDPRKKKIFTNHVLRLDPTNRKALAIAEALNKSNTLQQLNPIESKDHFEYSFSRSELENAPNSSNINNIDDIREIISQAEKAIHLGEKSTAIILVNRALKKDFNNTNAWQLLYKIIESPKPFLEFQIEFATKYFPDKAHLLSPAAPSWFEEFNSEKAKNENQLAKPTNNYSKSVNQHLQTYKKFLPIPVGKKWWPRIGKIIYFIFFFSIGTCIGLFTLSIFFNK